jgi:prepilin-type N-terminal cleavage/methylation domain-containing protein
MNSKKNGLSLIEVLLALSVFSVLVGFIVVNVNSTRTSGRDEIRVENISKITEALENFYLKYNCYPIIDYSLCESGAPTVANSNSSAWTKLENSLEGFYMTDRDKTLPVDPYNEIEEQKNIYYYSYYINGDVCCSQKYILKARLETKSKALENSYKKQDTSFPDNPDCSEREIPPFNYCVHSP